VFHESGEVARREHTLQLTIVAGHEHDTALFGQHDDGLPQRGARRKNRQGIRDHDFIYPPQQPPADRAARVQAGEILPLESLVLEERDRERVADCQ
jgi:hypothetical protein